MECTSAVRLAFHADEAVVGFHYAFDDGESQTGADDKSRLIVFYPVKTIKDMAQVFWSHTDAIIGDARPEVAALHCRGDGHLATIGGIVDGIADEIGKDLIHIAPVRKHGSQLG